MGDDHSKEEKDALDALELEAKEFDKVCLLYALLIQLTALITFP